MCRVCAKPCQVMKKEESGTSVKFSSDCQCGNTFTWLSQPYSRQLPLVNLVLAGAAFFTACSPTRLLDVFRASGANLRGSELKTVAAQQTQCRQSIHRQLCVCGTTTPTPSFTTELDL
ncbi:hypothetical protein ACOMHN_004950 [Nucella lapillus]